MGRFSFTPSLARFRVDARRHEIGKLNPLSPHDFPCSVIQKHVMSVLIASIHYKVSVTSAFQAASLIMHSASLIMHYKVSFTSTFCFSVGKFESSWLVYTQVSKFLPVIILTLTSPVLL